MNLQNRKNNVITCDVQHNFFVVGESQGVRVTPLLRRLVADNHFFRALPQLDSVQFWQTPTGKPLEVGTLVTWKQVRTGRVHFSKQVRSIAKQFVKNHHALMQKLEWVFKYAPDATGEITLTGDAFEPGWFAWAGSALLKSPRFREADLAGTLALSHTNLSVMLLHEENLVGEDWRVNFWSSTPCLAPVPPPFEGIKDTPLGRSIFASLREIDYQVGGFSEKPYPRLINQAIPDGDDEREIRYFRKGLNPEVDKFRPLGGSYSQQIFFPGFWEREDGTTPSPFEVVTAEAVNDGKIRLTPAQAYCTKIALGEIMVFLKTKREPITRFDRLLTAGNPTEVG